MKIDKDSIFLYIWGSVSDEILDEIMEILRMVGDAAADNANQVGVIPGRTFMTRAYTEIEGRFFRFTLNFRAIPFKIKRCQVDEVTKAQHDQGIEREKNDPKKTTDWL